MPGTKTGARPVAGRPWMARDRAVGRSALAGAFVAAVGSVASGVGGSDGRKERVGDVVVGRRLDGRAGRLAVGIGSAVRGEGIELAVVAGPGDRRGEREAGRFVGRSPALLEE